jgi:hypothetical protein
MTFEQGSLDTELTAYQVVANAPTIQPASTRRSWMTGTYEHFAYMCLPVVAANVSGWELLCPAEFTACWDGGAGRDSLRIDMLSPNTWAPLSHFGYGILTFDTGYAFRTSPGHNLWVKGPTNESKDGLSPLEGLIETDWLPYTFTMNYRFTRPNHTVRFEKDEPFCLIHPMPGNYLNQVKPALRLLNQNPELDVQHHDWARARKNWNAERLVPGTAAASAKWRRDYLRGQTSTGEKAARHTGAVPLRPFQDERP